MMQVQVNGEDISPEEFLEGNGWCTIRYKTQSNRETAQSNTQNGAHSHTGEGANGNRQRSRQQQRNVKQQVIRNSKMPLLPRSDFKIVIRPRGGLDVATTGTVRLASAIYRAANVPAQEAGEDTVCSNNRQNITVVNTPHATHAAKYRQLEAITIGDRRHEVSAYETAPDYTVKGIIRGIPLEEDAKAAEEAEEAAKATSSAGKSRSRSRTRSRGRSRSRSRTPDSRKQRRLRSRTPRRTATRDTETTEKVSWADAVTGKRAPTAKAGDKTPAKTETKIAKLTQAIQALQKQIEHMQTQIRAKDELIEQLQHAVKSGTDTEAMQETQEELIGNDEVVCPDTKRRPTPTENTQETQELIEDDEVEFPDTKRRPTPALTEATRRKRTRAAIRDARIDALEARLSNLEESIIASITRTIQQSLESVHLRLSRLEATNSTIVPSHREAAQHM
ncbi:hypothetical protein HPB49_012011 [Dermacentor silvarum]|uniref:Uncharacterized protein n=1 Tax=Dermacentor silvarum TaxID=543639 RepID=A0ACB8DNU9_DERSI|nr:hypothetical protein HPB49_012011 [Dermacentor silvarum]